LKVSELDGASLDAAVARCEGYLPPVMYSPNEGEPAALWMPHPTLPHFRVEDWHPSTQWAQGGPIIERERISVETDRMLRPEAPVTWVAFIWDDPKHYTSLGAPTPLIAAMRLYVMTKYGEELDEEPAP